MHYFVTLFIYIEEALFIYIEQPLSEINGHLVSYKLCLFYGRFGGKPPLLKIVLSVYFQLRLISVLVHVTVGVSDLMFLVH